jgi:hypothetical protein
MLTDVTFYSNSAGYDGGGIYNYAYNAYNHITLTNVTFSNNSAGDDGGGMLNDNCDSTLTNVTFSNNSAEDNAGGMRDIQGSTTLTNVTFSNNSAKHGGGMEISSISLTLKNVTFSNNSASYNGGGMNIFGDPTLANVILWGNTAGSSGNQIYKDDTSNPNISYSDIQGSGGSGAGWDTNLGTDGGGNIDADPLFVDAPNDDLHLSAGSSAIDTGDDNVCPAMDLDGVLRPQGEGCDMGAYEYVLRTEIYLPLVMDQ